MKKTSHRRTFRAKLALTLMCVSALLVVAIAFASYHLANAKIMEMGKKLSDNNADTAAQALKATLGKAHDYTTQILRAPALQRAATAGRPETTQLNPAIAGTLNAAASEEVRFAYVNVYLENGYRYASNPLYDYPFDDYESCLSYFVDTGLDFSADYTRMQWALCASLEKKTGLPQSHLVSVRFLYDAATMKKTGVLVAAVHNETLYKAYGRFSEDGYIVDASGIVLSCRSDKRVGTPMEDAALQARVLDSGLRSAVFAYRRPYGKQTIISQRVVLDNCAYLISPFDYYASINRAETVGYIKSIVLLVLAGVLTAGVLAFFLSRSLTGSIRSLTGFVKHVYDGNFNRRFIPTGDDEIAYLGEKTNDMLDRIQVANEAREQELVANQRLELNLMQSQINPHLLYNTLDSALWAVQNNDAQNASDLLASLSGFFKISLSQGHSEIALTDELDLIRHYISIQHLARQKDIRLLCDVEPALLCHPIVKLTLQPIVENAILHGFSGYRDDGEIEIRAAHTDGILTITVTDNGIGLLPEEVLALNRTLQIYPPPQKLHFGLYAVNRRLVQAYGAGFGISLESEVSEYTRVRLRMPYRAEGGQTHV